MSHNRVTQLFLSVATGVVLAVACGQETIDLAKSTSSNQTGDGGSRCDVAECEKLGGVCDDTGACVECTVDATCEKNPVLTRCDRTTHSCVMCLEADECQRFYDKVRSFLGPLGPPDVTWQCDPVLLRCRPVSPACPFGIDEDVGGACIECTSNDFCKNLGPTLNFKRCDDGKCLGCLANDDCGAGRYCQPPTGTCVECYEQDHCPTGTYCDLRSHKCQLE